MDKQVYLIGNAHLDPVWLWKRREGYAEIKATFQSALDRMGKFDHFIFSCSSASYYQWLEKNEPAMFEKIKQRIAEGRWAIVGGMWVQPDCNLPSGEAFARQLLYSQRYFLEKFGRIATVGYNVDSFGHNGMLPQLLKKAGIDSYVFMRPGNGECTLPYLFDWQSPDGSCVTAFRISCEYGDHHWGYTTEKYGSLSIYEAKVERVKEISAEDGVPHMLFYGVGNHGGGPTVRCLEELKKITAKQTDVVHASPMDYFADIKKQNIELPLVQTDLQHHASGCYSAGGFIKKSNRLTENRLVSAEKYDVLANLLTQQPSEKKTIRAAYEKLLFNQFHDILCGCCIKDALIEAERYFNAAWALGEDVAESALQKIAWNINTSGGIKDSPTGKDDWMLWETKGQGAPVIVFNPHAFPVKQLIQLSHGGISAMTDENGEPITIDYTRGQQSNGAEPHGIDAYNTLFMADVPAYGYRTYYVYTQKELEATKPTMLSVTETSLENEFIKVEFDRRTGGFSLFDKKQDMKLIENGGLPLVMDDSQSDTWAHMVFSFHNQIGRFSDPVFEVINQGPLRAAIRVTSSYNRSVIRQDFILDSFSKKLTVKCRIDFHESKKLVKLAFPIAGECKEALYEMPFGFIKKECNGMEEPSHRYMSMSGKFADGRWGSVALLNDSKYSFSAQDNTMYMTAVRGCGYADHYWDYRTQVDYMDQGRQEFCYELLPHENDNLAEVTQNAMLLNQPMEHVMGTNHDGILERTYSGISVSVDNVVCETVKYAETEDALVLRIYETSGKPALAKIALHLPSYKTAFSLSFDKHEVKTMMIFTDGRIKEVNLIEL